MEQDHKVVDELIDSREEMCNLLRKCKKEIHPLKLSEYWKGFEASPIALYNKEEICVINHNSLPNNFVKLMEDIYIGKWNTSFLGNTAIDYSGQYMAIWNMNEDIEYESLYAGIVHELFHSYQLKCGEERWANELLAVKYPYTKNNIALRLEERKKLLKAVFEKDDKRLEYIKDFISCREQRKEEIQESLNYELALESIEGTASYVEYKAYLDKTKLPREFILSKYGKSLVEDNDGLLKFRESCYTTGLYMCILLDSLGVDWQEEYMNSKLYLYEFLLSKINVMEKTEVYIDDYSKAERMLKLLEEQKRKALYEFYKKEDKKITLEGNMMLACFDPMNVIPIDGLILHKNFIKLSNEKEEMYLNGPVLAKHNAENLWQILEVQYINKEIV